MIARSLTLALMATAGALTISAGPATAASQRVYAGWLNTPGWDNGLVARTDSRGKRVTSMVVALPLTCVNGSTYVFHTELKVVRRGSTATGVLVPRRNSGGRFIAKYRQVGPVGPSILDREVWVSGRFKRRSARGTLRLTGVVSDPVTGEATTTCDTTTYKWTIKRHRRWIYGGASSQGEPVVIYLNRARSKVAEIAINWNAPCSDGGLLDVPNSFTNFRLRRGKFGDIWGDTFSGTKFEYHLKGRIKRRSAAGAFEVDAFPGGGTSCRTGYLTWTARTG